MFIDRKLALHCGEVFINFIKNVSAWMNNMVMEGKNIKSRQLKKQQQKKTLIRVIPQLFSGRFLLSSKLLVSMNSKSATCGNP